MGLEKLTLFKSSYFLQTFYDSHFYTLDSCKTEYTTIRTVHSSQRHPFFPRTSQTRPASAKTPRQPLESIPLRATPRRIGSAPLSLLFDFTLIPFLKISGDRLASAPLARARTATRTHTGTRSSFSPRSFQPPSAGARSSAPVRKVPRPCFARSLLQRAAAAHRRRRSAAGSCLSCTSPAGGARDSRPPRGRCSRAPRRSRGARDVDTRGGRRPAASRRAVRIPGGGGEQLAGW